METRRHRWLILSVTAGWVAAVAAPPPPNARLGIGLATQGGNRLAQFEYQRLHLSWYFDWSNGAVQGPVGSITYMPLIGGWGFNNIPSQQTIQNWINTRPGVYPNGTIWTIGNEIGFDDNRTPQQYAADYHLAYTRLKAVNPTFRVCNGAVFPIDRLHNDNWGGRHTFDGREYMTDVMAAYRAAHGVEMPIDAWMIHGYSVADWYSLDRFRELITAWRRWMADNGQRDKPLLMKEFSPLPGGSVDVIGNYLIESHRILHTLHDPALGPAEQHGLLMQGFAWFVNNDGEDQFEGQWDDVSLFDSDTKQMRPLGEIFERMAVWHIGSESASLTNGDMEWAAAGQAAGWKPWQAAGSVSLATPSSAAAARGGDLGLRLAASPAGQRFDGAMSQFIPGMRADRYYRLRGYVRCAPGAGRTARVGLDPTGQQADGSAATVAYTAITPAGGGWALFESAPVRAYSGALTVWLRAATTLDETWHCDYDDVTLVEESTPLANPYAVGGAPANAAVVSALPRAGAGYHDWSLDAGNDTQLLRTTFAYGSADRPVPFHAWDPVGGQFVDGAALAAWAGAHPGKTWIIGLWPDAEQGENLSPEDYARWVQAVAAAVLHVDPTARAAAGPVSQTGNTARDWWNAVHSHYIALSGAPKLPFGVWTVSARTAPATGAGEVVSETVLPAALSTMRAVAGGTYADLPVWVGDLGLDGSDAAEQLDFIRRACPRLERTPCERWFFRAGALLESATGELTALGVAYLDLARAYVNSVPAPVYVKPAQPRPRPPALYVENFNSGRFPNWRVNQGQWKVDLQALQVELSSCGANASLPYWYEDFTVEVKMRIQTAAHPTNWVGMVLRNQHESLANRTGYLVYFRRNGELGIHNSADGQVVAIPGAVPDANQFHVVRAQIRGPRIDVWIDGAHRATWTDPQNKWTAGLFKLVACETLSMFDDLTIWSSPNSVLEVY